MTTKLTDEQVAELMEAVTSPVGGTLAQWAERFVPKGGRDDVLAAINAIPVLVAEVRASRASPPPDLAARVIRDARRLLEASDETDGDFSGARLDRLREAREVTAGSLIALDGAAGSSAPSPDPTILARALSRVIVELDDVNGWLPTSLQAQGEVYEAARESLRNLGMEPERPERAPGSSAPRPEGFPDDVPALTRELCAAVIEDDEMGGDLRSGTATRARALVRSLDALAAGVRPEGHADDPGETILLCQRWTAQQQHMKDGILALAEEWRKRDASYVIPRAAWDRAARELLTEWDRLALSFEAPGAAGSSAPSSALTVHVLPGPHEIREGVPFWTPESANGPVYQKRGKVPGCVTPSIHDALTFATRAECEAWIVTNRPAAVPFIAVEHLVCPPSSAEGHADDPECERIAYERGRREGVEEAAAYVTDRYERDFTQPWRPHLAGKLRSLTSRGGGSRKGG